MAPTVSAAEPVTTSPRMRPRMRCRGRLITTRSTRCSICTAPNGEIQFDKDVLAARQYFLEHVNQNTVFFQSGREARLPDPRELLRARGARPVLAQLRPHPAGSRLRQEVPLPDLRRRHQVLHLLVAEDPDGKRYLERSRTAS